MKTILLIENNPDIRKNLTEFLELENYKVLGAENGDSAIKFATEDKPDLIVCNVMIPALDGYGVILLLQKSKDTRDIPLIFLTTVVSPTETDKRTQLIADDYLIKPIKGTELLNVIRHRLQVVNLANEKLKGITGFNTLIDSISGKEALDKFIEDREIRTYKKKQMVYAEGRNSNKLFYIQKGKIKTFKMNDEGKELIIGMYNEGDFLGYSALLDGMIYKDTAEAIEECEIAILPKNEFDELIYSNHEVLLLFVHLLADNVADNSDQLLSLAYGSIRKKVAEVLIAFSNKYKTENATDFSINLSRENLANMAGIAKESMIRTLSSFKDENLIEITNGNILILNEKGLVSLMN